jgi:hypothetical protein
MSDKPARENQRQNAAFLAYSRMPEPSVQNLWESWVKIGGLNKYKRSPLRTLEDWRSRYQWVVRSEAIHQAAKEEAVKREIEDLAMSKKEILAITRTVMIRYDVQLRDNLQGKIRAVDFEKAWRIQRIELGLPTEIGKQQVEVKDEYGGASDEELLNKLDYFSTIYKKKLKQK